ncbi:unnamed protein product, partial [Chrysoparadoxa australica]
YEVKLKEIKLGISLKICLLSPYFPPVINGLSHYSHRFADELVFQGNSLTVCCQEGLGEGSGHTVLNFSHWNIFTFLTIFWKLRNSDNERVLIQYVPHMYDKRGVNFSLPLFIILLRTFSQIKIDIMFHELHYPLEPQLKSIVLWFLHHLMLIPSLWFSHTCFFSTEKYLRKCSLLTGEKKLFFLPVGSNIPRSMSENRSNDKRKKIILFAGPHPSKDFKFFFLGLQNFKDEFELVFLGTNEIDFEKYYGSDYQKFHHQFLGKVSDDEVSSVLKNGYCLVAYFTDGLTSRRGSVLAALNNGLPV